MVSAADIEIFSRVPSDQLEQVEALFSARSFEKGTEILVEGKPVDGLYLIVDGAVDVHITGYTGVVTTLSSGNSFGEMSLFKDDDVASATISVASEVAEVLFCARPALMELLKENSAVSEGFYHGSALMLANRLRTTNEKIGGEIASSLRQAMELVEDIASKDKLGLAQHEIQDAGSSIIYGMTGVLRTLLAMKQSGTDVPHDEISELADTAKDLYYSEFQVFERIHQQLLSLGQLLENVRRTLNQENPVQIADDDRPLQQSDED